MIGHLYSFPVNAIGGPKNPVFSYSDIDAVAKGHAFDGEGRRNRSITGVNSFGAVDCHSADLIVFSGTAAGKVSF